MDDHTIVGRVLDILAATHSSAQLTLAELSATTGIPKPTVHRIAQDLVRRGILVRTEMGYQTPPEPQHAEPDHCASDVSTMTLQTLAHLNAALENLHEHVGGFAWYLRSTQRLTPRPTLLVGATGHNAGAMPVTNLVDTLTGTALGYAVLACRPDLLDWFVSEAATPLASTEVRALTAALRQGADRGAYFEPGATTGWRCVAVHARLKGDSHPGVIGVTTSGSRVQDRVLIRETIRAQQEILAQQGA